MLADPHSRQPRLNPQGPVFSVVVHAAIILAVTVWIYRTPRIAPFRLPGTAKGHTLLTYYSPGSSKPSATDSPVRSKRTKDAKSESRKAVVETAVPPAPPHADAGIGATTDSGLGEGDIRIALLQHFPSPHPDLSAMAHGTKGDIVLDAVIDEHGRIATLTLLKGLDPTIDQTVIATVRQWLFTPATKDGVPVVSEQEFHFHYERG